MKEAIDTCMYMIYGSFSKHGNQRKGGTEMNTQQHQDLAFSQYCRISGVTKVSSAVHFIMPDEASVGHSPAFVLFGVSQPGQPFFSVLGFAVQLH